MNPTGENNISDLKRIAVLANCSWNLYNFRLSLLKKLSERYELVAIASKDDYFKTLQTQFHCLHIPAISAIHNPLVYLRCFAEILRILKVEKPNLILTFTFIPNILGTIAGRILNIPTLPTITGLGFLIKKYNLTAILGLILYKEVFKKIPFIAFHNESDKAFFISNGIINKNQGIIIPGSGIDLDHFPFSPPPAHGSTTFLMASRLIQNKGIKEFVEAARLVKKQFPETNFHLAGIPALHQLTALPPKTYRLVKNAHFIRFVQNPGDITALIKKAHCVVLPSKREGLSRFLLEGMAMGRPIITTDVPGCRELINKNGILIKHKCTHSLADAFSKMHQLPISGKQQMGKRSRILVKKFYSSDIINQLYLQLIEKLFQY